VSVRRLAAFLPLVAGLLLGSTLTSPASAVVVPTAVPDPVTGLVVDTVTQGANQTWVIPFHWTASGGATAYTVKVTNLSGTEDYGTTKDVPGTTTTVNTGALAAGTDYEVSVAPKNADGDGTAVTAQFTAPTLDTTAPNGTFTVVPTHAWLLFDFLSLDESPQSASVTIKQVTLSDDTSTTITRRVLPGDGTSARSWASGSSLVISYTKAGTFTPKVELTDGFGNTRAVPLSPVTISEDTTAPVVRITRPSSSMRDRIAGWRKIRGTAVDGQTGVDTVLVMLVQKRGAYWYVYNFHKHVWLKGRTGQIATLAHTKARPAILSTDSLDQWHTARIRGLKTGKIVVRSVAFDNSINLGMAIVRQRITRP